MPKDPESLRVLDFAPVDPEHRPGRLRPLEPRYDPPTLNELARTIFEAPWTILTVAVLVLVLAAAYLLVAQPMYETHVLIQVEGNTKTLAGLDELESASGDRTPAETAMEIIRSRKLLGSVVDQLGLDVEVHARRLPFVGDSIARKYRGASPAPARLGLSPFGWGGERIRVQQLELSGDLLGATIVVRAEHGGRYRVATADGSIRFEGEAGKLARGSSGDRRIEILISELIAAPETHFLVMKRHRTDAVDRLRESLHIDEKGKDTGTLMVTLEGDDPKQVAAVLNAIATAYIRQNVERRSAAAAKMLDLLNSKLPVLESRLDKAEAALTAFHRRNGLVDVSRETTAMLERTVEFERALSELELQEAELRHRYSDKHPQLRSIATNIQVLRAQRARLNVRLSHLNGTEMESARLTRDVSIASELYSLFFSKAEELRIFKSGVSANVTVLDQAHVPLRPSRPKGKVVFAIALLLGLGGGVATGLVRRSLNDRIDNADEVEAGARIPVLVTIPHSDKEAVLERGAASVEARPALVAVAPDDFAVESVRALRTALNAALGKAKNSIVAVSAPTRGEGKSFVCANLAHLSAAAGRKVLLVDADLRRGRLHRYFSQAREPGLSDVISGAATLDDALRSTNASQVDLLPTGRVPLSPAEMLASLRFQQVFIALSQRYDLVIVESPPVLAVTDAVLVACCAGVNLLVIAAGRHSMSDIVLSVKLFAQNGVPLQGAVLNDVRVTRHRFGQQLEYRSESSA
jgi:tyrosine-protein kinase Etk/Wzc